jgi:hypothetical protein
LSLLFLPFLELLFDLGEVIPPGPFDLKFLDPPLPVLEVVLLVLDFPVFLSVGLHHALIVASLFHLALLGALLDGGYAFFNQIVVYRAGELYPFLICDAQLRTYLSALL